MKTTYEFTDEDEERRQVFEKASDFYTALWQISSVLREHRKYESHTPEVVMDRIGEIISDSGMWEIP